MVADISVADGARRALAFRRIVVIGGGCYGSWYTQQLTRAIRRDALAADEIVVVDRDPTCLVAQRLVAGAYAGAPVRLHVGTWDAYLAEWLAVATVAELAGHAMVPSPLMPHLCFDWLVARARQRWPDRALTIEPLPSAPPTPWERGAPDARHYVSYATWTCPVNCIEPARCPATRDRRWWSMPAAMHRYASAEPALGRAVIFHCEHRTYGVGMIDADVIAAADRQVATWGAEGPVRVLVGTVSHCHGALGVLAVA